MGIFHPTVDGLIVQVNGAYSKCRQIPVDYINWGLLRAARPNDAENVRSTKVIDPFSRVRFPYGFATDRLRATGHTLSDQAETVLYRLVTSGTAKGIKAKREDGVVRPLLCLWRDETRAYCEQEGLPFREDSSNPGTVRGLIRDEVLPLLRRIHPAADVNLLRALETRETLPPALAELLASPAGSKRVDLGGGVQAVREYDRLWLERSPVALDREMRAPGKTIASQRHHRPPPAATLQRQRQEQEGQRGAGIVDRARRGPGMLAQIMRPEIAVGCDRRCHRHTGFTCAAGEYMLIYCAMRGRSVRFGLGPCGSSWRQITRSPAAAGTVIASALRST